jgi:hypothetical protein
MINDKIKRLNDHTLFSLNFHFVPKPSWEKKLDENDDRVVFVGVGVGVGVGIVADVVRTKDWLAVLSVRRMR